MTPEGITLDGPWRAALADEPLRRVFVHADFDDAGWEHITVPGHWRSTPAFAGVDGPLLYRHRFSTPAAEDRRWWLTLDGVFYDGDVWLDGDYVGVTEGYFFPHSFEITDAVKTGDSHVLAIEVGCSRPTDMNAKRNLTGVFQHWDCLDPEWNPGGLWLPVHVSSTGSVRTTKLRVLCDEATPERAGLTVRAEIDAAAATLALLRVTVERLDGTTVADAITRHHLAHGANRLRTRVVVEQPALWWPHALGDQPLHRVTVTVFTPDDATIGDAVVSRRRWARGRDEAEEVEGTEGYVPSDVRSVVTGLRQVHMKQWIMTVNGERLFLKGSNQGPTQMALGAATAAELERDIVLAKDAGLDLLRVHGHVGREETYEAADRHGVLLWQDLPLQWAYARSVRKQAMRQAREAVDLLSHHPSIAVWCAHNEPVPVTSEPESVARIAATQTLPSWNKTILDSSVSRALERADPTRPVVSHSGVLPGPLTAGTDTHLYFGWYYRSERDLPRVLAAMPSLARFVTEFGAQAVPTSAEWMEPSRWPLLDWSLLESRHALQLHNMSERTPVAAYATFDEWRDATQEYQATLIRFCIETLRRLKYRPTGGFAQFCFADGHDAVTWSVLDASRTAKRGYGALAAACAPVIVVATWPLESYEPGAPLELDVHVVNDLRRPLSGLRVLASVGGFKVGWAGAVPADDCALVGTLRTVAPAAAGPFEVSLSLSGDGVTATNRYTSTVA